MARTINMAVLVVVGVLAAALLRGTEAAIYTVGDSTGWAEPISNTTFYSAWAAGKSFAVGDILVFNFATGQHDVATVSQAAYAACTTTNTINLVSQGPASITLTSGTQYYICTIGSGAHCNAGQKLSITVTSTGSSPTPPGTVTPPPPPPPPPSPSSASSVVVATFSVIFMSIVIGLLC